MKVVIIGSTEIRITYSGSDETSYIRTLIDRLNFAFKPTIISSVMGIILQANSEEDEHGSM